MINKLKYIIASLALVTTLIFSPSTAHAVDTERAVSGIAITGLALFFIGYGGYLCNTDENVGIGLLSIYSGAIFVPIGVTITMYAFEDDYIIMDVSLNNIQLKYNF